MADNWFSEIELQKVFSLSPKEAYCHVCAENGMKASEIAEVSGISPNTVKVLIQRGANKMKKDTKKASVIVIKGNRDVEGVAVKQHAIEVVMNFVALALDIPFKNLNHTYVLEGIDSNKPGDVQWLKERVFRKVDIMGTTNPAESKMRAEKLLSVYNTANEGQEKVGLGIVKYYLDQMYMQYDITE